MADICQHSWGVPVSQLYVWALHSHFEVGKACDFPLPLQKLGTQAEYASLLQEFNKSIFDYLIATDDPAKREEHADLNERAAAKADAAPLQKGKKRKGIEAEKQQQQQRKRAKKAEQDGEFGVIRGIDFKGVRTVINVDAPDTVQVTLHNAWILETHRHCLSLQDVSVTRRYGYCLSIPKHYKMPEPVACCCITQGKAWGGQLYV